MIRVLKETDILGLNRLPPTDWKFDYEDFLKNFKSDDFFDAFVMVEDDEIIGTGNVLLQGKVGWLANIIVDEKYRGKGLGFEMTKFLVKFLESKGCETQLLIATQLGEYVYKKIGFKILTQYECFDSENEYAYHTSDAIRKLEIADLKNVYQLDQDANGENRMHLIDKFYGNGLGYFNQESEMIGFYLPKFGRGLIVSKDKEAGLELLKLKHSEKGRRTLLPIENKDGLNLLESLGLKKGAQSSKMIFGKYNHWKPNYIYSYASGYCG